jgi:SepF-like predicted cell division protein (DUF552 family)
MFPQDLALDGRETTFYEELPPKESEEPPKTLKNVIELSTLSGLVDDVANGNLPVGNKLITDIKNLRKRKRAAQRDREELERDYKQLGQEIRCQLEEDVDTMETDVKILKTKIHALLEDSDDDSG